jgi:hypothetical protein
MALGYRAVLGLRDDGDAAEITRQQLRCWIRDKGFHADDLDPGQRKVGPEAFLRVSDDQPADGSRTLHHELREKRDDGTQWMTTLITHRPARPCTEWATSWIWIDIEAIAADGQIARRAAAKTKPPRLARYILDAVDAYDGPAMLRSHAARVREEDVDQLIDVLCDPDRRLPAVVATRRTCTDPHEWENLVANAMGNLTGLASLYLLDCLAADRFNFEIGSAHRVFGGAIRTYLPRVDPASPSDATRHRVLSARRLEYDPWHAQSVLTALPRERALERELPPELRSVGLA